MLDDWEIRRRGRPVRGGVALHPRARLHGDDHSQGARRARFLGADAQPSGDEGRKPQPGGRSHRDGAQLARPCRAADALRHRCAARLLSAAAGAGAGDSLLRADRAGSGLGRGLDPGQGRRLLRRAQGQARARHEASPGTSATSRWRRWRRSWASRSGSTIPTICSATRTTSASRSRSFRPTRRACRSGGVTSRRAKRSRTGPTQGNDVFIPMDYIIGGQERVGQGWRMLMDCLAAGRAISLPALGTGAAMFCARFAGAYARIRRQFGLPIGRFEGIEDAARADRRLRLWARSRAAPDRRARSTTASSHRCCRRS